jgi:hypothetical protein
MAASRIDIRLVRLGADVSTKLADDAPTLEYEQVESRCRTVADSGLGNALSFLMEMLSFDHMYWLPAFDMTATKPAVPIRAESEAGAPAH